MITLSFGKIDLVFMLLTRCLLLVRMIAGVVLLSFYFFLLREFWNRDGWMFLRAVDVVDGFLVRSSRCGEAS